MKQEIIDFLAMYGLCQEFYVLPAEGGLLDQTQQFFEAAILTKQYYNQLSKKPENADA